MTGYKLRCNSGQSELQYKKELRFKYDLQFFAGDDKTEPATPKHLEDARKEGRVAKSQDLNSGISLLMAFVAIKLFGLFTGGIFKNSFEFFYNMMPSLTHNEFTSQTSARILSNAIIMVIIGVIPYLLVLYLVSLVQNVMQFGFKVTPKAAEPKLSKLNPINGVKRIFSLDKVMELLRSVLKIGVTFLIVFNDIKASAEIIFNMYDMPLFQTMSEVFTFVINTGIKISAVFTLIGFADLFYQKWKFKHDLRMSKQEVKDEYKNDEGDPQVKGQIKQKMREASRRRMMQEIPKADVVITNPTHFAVALTYDKDRAPAPMVVAKGADYLAQKIKETARESNVEIVENRPLARMLYYNVEIGDQIPPELYQMVAEVLAYVYKVKNKVVTE